MIQEHKKKRSPTILPPLPDSKSKYDSASDDSIESDDNSDNKQIQLDNEKADAVESKLKMNEEAGTDSKSTLTSHSVLNVTQEGSSHNASDKSINNNDFKEMSHDVNDGKSNKLNSNLIFAINLK